jgi:hypothetical protein
MMRIFVLFLAIIGAVVAEETIPDWVLIGIPSVESKSWWSDDGVLHYVDQRRGSHGELGPWQMRRIAFNDIRQHGEQYWRIEVDREFAAECAARYLRLMYERSGSWELAVQWFHAGPHHRAPEYLNAVRAAGSKP